MKGRDPEGGHLWLALPSALILQMTLQVFPPHFPIWKGGAGTIRRSLLVLPTLFGISLSDTSRHSRTKPPLTLTCCLHVRGSPDLKAALRLLSSLCR